MAETCKRVPKDIVLVRVGPRTWRIGKIRNTEGYTHINPEPWGITGITEMELLEGTFNFTEAYRMLAQYASDSPTEDWKG